MFDKRRRSPRSKITTSVLRLILSNFRQVVCICVTHIHVNIVLHIQQTYRFDCLLGDTHLIYSPSGLVGDPCIVIDCICNPPSLACFCLKPENWQLTALSPTPKNRQLWLVLSPNFIEIAMLLMNSGTKMQNCIS